MSNEQMRIVLERLQDYFVAQAAAVGDDTLWRSGHSNALTHAAAMVISELDVLRCGETNQPSSLSYQDLLDGQFAMLQAAGGSGDIDQLQQQLNAAGTKPSHFIKKQIDDRDSRIAELQEKLVTAQGQCLDWRYARDTERERVRLAEISLGQRAARIGELTDRLESAKKEIDDLRAGIREFKTWVAGDCGMPHGTPGNDYCYTAKNRPEISRFIILDVIDARFPAASISIPEPGDDAQPL